MVSGERGGKGDIAIEERPFWISVVVEVIAEVVFGEDSFAVSELLVVDSEAVPMGIDVNPGTIVSGLCVAVATVSELLSGTELRPLTVLIVVD